MADGALFARDGVRDVDRRDEDYQIGRYGYGEAGKISGLCGGYLRDGGASGVFADRYAGFHHACEDDGDYGRRCGEAIPVGQLGGGEGNGAHLADDFPRLRSDRISDDETVHLYFLKIHT